MQIDAGLRRELSLHRELLLESQGDSLYDTLAIQRHQAAIFEIGASEYRLVVLDDGDGGSFIPFRDATAGVETYGGGRYVGIEVAADGTAVVDFNRAGNPWCVYDDEFTCPLPPPSNVIVEPVTAGEKMWRPERGR